MSSPTVEITKVIPNEIVKSTSASSLSSIGSNSSTGKLIKSLSTDHLKKDEAITIQPLTPPLSETTNHNQIPPTASDESSKPVKPTLNNNNNNNNNNKKPIKFTVRKVSHEPIKSPSVENGNFKPYEKENHRKSRTTSSSSQGATTVTTLNAGDDKEEERFIRINNQLDQTQAHFDQYHSRIIKIEKEIAFLTNLLPPYYVEIDYATRIKINKAIEKLRMKKDEIEKKKYSLGITLSRLSRELDDSAIWVRSAGKR